MHRVLITLSLLVVCSRNAWSAEIEVVDDAVSGTVQASFESLVQPFLSRYCFECHSAETIEGDLDLGAYSQLNEVTKDFRRWSTVLDRIERDEMPPEDADAQPSDAERGDVIQWITDVRTREAKRTSGDPGIVLAHRLSNAQYDNTIRDLTGADIRPTAEFPIDPANEAGFDNTGESLTMSPALVKKYLEAARLVSDHLVLTPTGLDFAPHPVVTETDCDKYCVNRIIEFYQQHQVDYADYFLAAWEFQHRSERNAGEITLDELAQQQGLSVHYLTTIWKTLSEDSDSIGPIAALRELWRELPADASTPSQASHQSSVREACEQMSDLVTQLRDALVPHVANLTAPGVHNGSQPLVLWKNRQFAANRMRYAGGAEKIAELKLSDDLQSREQALEKLVVPTDAESLREYENSLQRFCETFPDAFFVSERARVYLDPNGEKSLTGRYLSAGFHSQMGYFRDDEPLCKLVLSKPQRDELDQLWLELDFVASAPMRQYAGFIWFDRTDSAFMRDSEFDLFRAEDKDCISEKKVRQLCDLYLAKSSRNEASETALEAIEDYFQGMSDTFRRLETLRRESEPLHLDGLVNIAERAFRRPIETTEREDLVRFYRVLREEEGLTHDQAIRDGLVAILMSPHFNYRADLPVTVELDDVVINASSIPVQPLDDFALASRLSYFLWSSMPDRTLLDLASRGKLRDPNVLLEQARRMLRDERARGFAIEFAGQWLDFRRFEQHQGVERERFPQFTNELRQAMFEEPIRFFVDVAKRDGSVLDFLDADYTFVNAELAKHYEMNFSRNEASDWLRLEGAGQYGRGGLLPMAVFLTSNSPGLRTSPVKRGNWLVKRMLGEHIPPPPASVPELPSDESKLGDLTLRESLARHREDISCAACHEKIDSFGLVFEGYGVVGERREVDLGGREIDATVDFPNGTHGEGLQGLKSYIRNHRQQDFIENLCRQLLAYGLSRTLQLSDEETIAIMQAKLATENYRFGSLVESIVTSPQFLNQRAF